MNADKINAWLQDPKRDYSIGLSIYNHYKINNKFDDFFSKVENPDPKSMQFTLLVQKITDIVRKLKQNPALIKQIQQTPITVKAINLNDGSKKKSGSQSFGYTDSSASENNSKRPRIVDNPLVDVKELPPHLQQLYFENKKLTKEIVDLHEKLKALSPDKKHNNTRKGLANNICLRDDKRAANWLEIDTWWKENKTLTDEQKQEFDARKTELKATLKEAKKILQRIDTLKINISREKKSIEGNPKSDKAEKSKSKIDAWQKELDELEEKMK